VTVHVRANVLLVVGAVIFIDGLRDSVSMDQVHLTERINQTVSLNSIHSQNRQLIP